MTLAAPVRAFPFRLEQRPTQAQLIDALAALLEEHLRRRLAARSAVKPLGLATGRTMEPLYAAVVQRVAAWSETDLNRLRRAWSSFNLDEYLGLPSADPRGYRHYMDRHLGHPLRLPAGAMHLPDGSSADGQAAAMHYCDALRKQGGVGLQLLGLGSNGHIGFNEPPCRPHLPCRVVQLSDTTRQQNAGMFGGDPGQVPTHAITLGLQEILAAEEIHLVVTGAAKAGILRQLVDTTDPDEHLPASWLRLHQRVWLWVDAAAMQPS